MIQRLHDALGTSARSLNLRRDDVKVKKLPNKQSRNLELKIKNSIEGILEQIELWQMVFVDPKDLEKIVPKMREKRWRKHNREKKIKEYDDAQGNQHSIQVRNDITTMNILAWNVQWMNFLLSDDNWIKDHIVASIYEIWWERKILLLRDVAEHPILARKFLALVLDKYRSVKDK